MFVYLLIGTELALIWWVYWYLFVRDPKHRQQINGSVWGSYNSERLSSHSYDHEEQFMWDQRSKRYIPVSQFEAESLLARMAAKLDRQLSELNCKP